MIDMSNIYMCLLAVKCAGNANAIIKISLKMSDQKTGVKFGATAIILNMLERDLFPQCTQS